MVNQQIDMRMYFCIQLCIFGVKINAYEKSTSICPSGFIHFTKEVENVVKAMERRTRNKKLCNKKANQITERKTHFNVNDSNRTSINLLVKSRKEMQTRF